MQKVRLRMEAASRGNAEAMSSVQIVSVERKETGGEVMKLEEMFELKGRGTSRVIDEDKIKMIVTTSGSHKKPATPNTIAITIGAKIMHEMRWVIGDRVAIDFDCQNSMFTMSRVPEGSDRKSWMLTASYGRKKKQKGCVMKARVQIAASPIMIKAFGMDDAKSYMPDSFRCSDAGITIPLRKQWTNIH